MEIAVPKMPARAVIRMNLAKMFMTDRKNSVFNDLKEMTFPLACLVVSVENREVMLRSITTELEAQVLELESCARCHLQRSGKSGLFQGPANSAKPRNLC